MNPQLERGRIYIYLAFAFGIAWVTALVIYLTGGLQNSPESVTVPSTVSPAWASSLFRANRIHCLAPSPQV